MEIIKFNKETNIFVYGMSGSGKDTVANFLRDNYNFMKLRIAGTIKQYVYETYGFKSLEEFEQVKRINSEVRIAHNAFGNYYDKNAMQLSNNLASLNRLQNLIDRKAFEFDMIKDFDKSNVCICDARCIEEIEMLLNAGWYGIFLNRTTNEYKDSTHRTEQPIYEQDSFKTFIELYVKQCYFIDNSNAGFNNWVNLVPENTSTDHLLWTDGTNEGLYNSVKTILSDI